MQVAEHTSDPFSFAVDIEGSQLEAQDPFQMDDLMGPFGESTSEEEPLPGLATVPRRESYEPFQDAQPMGAEGLSNGDSFREGGIFDATDLSMEMDSLTEASADTGQQGLILSGDVRSSAEKVLEVIKSLADSHVPVNPALIHINRTMNAIWHILLTQCSSAQPQFLFKDGPVVEAASLGYQLLLEDLDAPSQAVTERLNSILETERSFRVTENLLLADQPEIDIHMELQIFATVHQHHPQQTLKLSPAIRSRFTEVAVTGYTDVEIRDVVLQELQRGLCCSVQDAVILVKQLFALRALVLTPGSHASDIHRLMQWIDFICHHSSEISLTRRLLLGARFCYILPGGESMSDQLQTAWKDIFGTAEDLPWAQR